MNLKEAVQSADRALGPRLLYRLFEGAMQFENRNKRIKTGIVILLAARLTMRLKTIIHVREGWINWVRGEIVVPKFDACDCYQCWVEAYEWWLRQGIREIEECKEENQPEWFDDEKGLSNYSAEDKEKIPDAANLDSEMLVDYLCKKKHDPKTPSGGRVIPFGWSPRITAILLTFFAQYDCIEENIGTLEGWITEAAENAPGLDPDTAIAHGLRADGLTFFIRLTQDPVTGGEIGGQSDWQSINRYKAQLDRITTAEVYHAANKGKWAPPVIPEKPGQRFPLALDEEAIGAEWKDYDPSVLGHPEARSKRHKEKKDEKISLYHPRGDLHDSMPWDRAGFPDKDEIDYDRYEDHETPGHANENYEHVEGEPATSATTIGEYADPHDVSRESDPELYDQQGQLGDWDQSNAMVSPHPLFRLIWTDKARHFMRERRRELLVYTEEVVKMLTPTTAGPDWGHLKRILLHWALMILLLAVSFNQAGIYADATKQSVFLVSLIMTMLVLPWSSIDIEAAFRNRSKTTPTGLFPFN